METQLEAINTW